MAGGARNVAVRYGWSRQVRRGLLGNGAVLCGIAGEAQRGSSWFGVVLTGMEGSSKAGWDWQSAEWIVEVRLGRHGSLSYGVAG